MKKAIIGIKIDYDGQKIVNQKINNIKQLDNLMGDVKEKLK